MSGKFQFLVIVLIMMTTPVSGMELSRLVLTRDIHGSEPFDDDTTFFLVEKAVYCFTEFRDVKRQTVVTHRWFCGEKKMADIRLKIKPGPRWRTWSLKLFKECAGHWTVKILDAEGRQIGEKKFQILKG